MIFFTSDTHFFHKNICRGTSEWHIREGEEGIQKTRDFDTIEEMNHRLISVINSKVYHNDVLYHLGDWSFGGADKIQRARNMINCSNIHLIFGNHDQHITPFDSIYRRLFTSADYYRELPLSKANKANMICMFHYAARIWNKRHKESIFLYGHSHNSLPDAGDRSMDVGVDTRNDYSPYSLDEIMDIMKTRTNNNIDHHSKHTN